jgi:hypothetical protein
LFAVRLAWVILPFIRAVARLWRVAPSRAALPLLWIAAAFTAVILPGKFFDHYLLHLAPPLAIFAAPELARLWDKGWRAHPRAVFASTALVMFLIASQMAAFAVMPDIPRRIAADIAPTLAPGDTVFADERLQIIPYLLGTPLTSRYAHPTLITKPEHNAALDIDGDREMAAILGKRPRYLVVGERFRFRPLLDSGVAGYRIAARYPGLRGGETLLYRREGP